MPRKVSYINLAKIAFILQSLHGDHKKIFCQICQEISYSLLPRRALIKILYRDLVQRADVLPGDLFRYLEQRSYLEILTRIFCGDLLQAPSTEPNGDLARQLLQRTFQPDLAYDLLQRSANKELTEFYLVPLLQATLNEYHVCSTSEGSLEVKLPTCGQK